MAEALAALALRRQALAARASLQRLEVRSDVAALRESLRWPRAAAAIAASPRGRSALFGVLLFAAGSGRLARVVRIAAAALVVARLAARMAGPPHRSRESP